MWNIIFLLPADFFDLDPTNLWFAHYRSAKGNWKASGKKEQYYKAQQSNYIKI